MVLEVLQKTAFHICWDSVEFGVIFICCLLALGPILMTFGALETGLKIDDFRWPSGGGPGTEAPWPGGGKWYTPWPLLQ